MRSRYEAEGIKEFAERLKKRFLNVVMCGNQNINRKIDNLVKEMTENDFKERKTMIREQIDKILEKYYHETDENFTAHRYEKDENGKEQEIYFEDELKAYCQENNVSYKYECTSAYDSCGYDCSVGTIAFIDENSELQLMTVLYEYF